MRTKSVAHATLIQASVYALVALFIVTAAEVLLVLFGGILLAIFLHGVAHWMHTKTGMNEKAALALAILLPVLVMAMGG